MTDSAFDSFRKTLIEERERLSSALEYLQAENGDAGEEGMTALNTLATHLADLGTMTLDREIDDSLEEAAIQRMKSIDEALERIEKGTFGLCSSCGRKIAPERLEALPWTNLCIDCKRREERG